MKKKLRYFFQKKVEQHHRIKNEEEAANTIKVIRKNVDFDNKWRFTRRKYNKYEDLGKMAGSTLDNSLELMDLFTDVNQIYTTYYIAMAVNQERVEDD